MGRAALAVTLLLAASGAVVSSGCSKAPPPAAALGFEWPPVHGQPYPDLRLLDEEGKPVALSQFKGKVILLEPTAMTCPACQAFSGGNLPGIGGFAGGTPQTDLLDVEQAVERYAGGASLRDPNVVFVQLMLYDLANQAPSAEDVRKWRDHFQLRRRHPGIVFLLADPRMLGPASYDMIPGFHLIDTDFRFVSDSSGHRPRNDLWRELLPAFGRLARPG